VFKLVMMIMVAVVIGDDYSGEMSAFSRIVFDVCMLLMMKLTSAVGFID